MASGAACITFVVQRGRPAASRPAKKSGRKASRGAPFARATGRSITARYRCSGPASRTQDGRPHTSSASPPGRQSAPAPVRVKRATPRPPALMNLLVRQRATES
jgi:hypothetical protein